MPEGLYFIDEVIFLSEAKNVTCITPTNLSGSPLFALGQGLEETGEGLRSTDCTGRQRAPRYANAGPHEAVAARDRCAAGAPGAEVCSGSMIPDTNVGGKIATKNEVSDDQKTTFLYS